MAIIYDTADNTFTIHTEHSTWQMKVSAYGHLLHTYYGNKVEHADLSYLVRGIDRGFSGPPYAAREDRAYSLDTYPQEYSAFGAGDYRACCLHAEYGDGSQTTELLYDSHSIYKGKYSLSGLPAVWASEEEAQTLEIRLRDPYSGLKVILYYGVLEKEDVITRACRIVNPEKETVCLHKALSCCLDFGRDNLDMITFYGRHAMERTMQRSRIRHGRLSVSSVRGTSSHQENPFVILCEPDAGEFHGDCYGMAFVYSGNFIAEAEVDQVNQTRFTMGINPEGFRWQLEPGEEFLAPEVICSYTDQGFSRLSRNFHNLYRTHLIRSRFQNQRRPVLINNWEATEFAFTQQDLLSMAESARELGIELFVVDDGWFGSRNHDMSGLGDWFANTDKLPSGVGGLAQKIHDLGMQFGIWIEPEMVNEDSELFRGHPDWCLRVPGRAPNLERYQLVLDMSRAEVRDYLFESISRILEESHAEYVKWDMNRSLSDVWSGALPRHRQGELYHRYVLGVYDLMERFVSGYPDILWEGCSGGGGRFDAGILYYMPQIWCSDDTDAIERIQIQYGTSFGYPACAMGSHVSGIPNLQTGRSTPLETRGEVAMAGTFGYEMDVRRFTPREREVVKKQIDDFKRFYPVIQCGDYYRLTSPEENQEYAAWQFVTPDGSTSLVSVVGLHAKANPPLLSLRIRGLKAEALYRIEGNDRVYPGNALMHGGIPLPVFRGDYQNIHYYIQEIKQEEHD